MWVVEGPADALGETAEVGEGGDEVGDPVQAPAAEVVAVDHGEDLEGKGRRRMGCKGRRRGW